MAKRSEPTGPTREEAVELLSDGMRRMTGFDRWLGHRVIVQALILLTLEVRDASDSIVAAIKAMRKGQS